MKIEVMAEMPEITRTRSSKYDELIAKITELKGSETIRIELAEDEDAIKIRQGIKSRMSDTSKVSVKTIISENYLYISLKK